jgi:hypothetical protein
VTITVHSAPVITSANNTTFTVGVNGNFTVTTTGSPTPGLSFTGSLPSPITFVDNGDGTATISGTPAGASVTTITITAANGVGTNATQTFTLTASAVSCTTNCTISGNVSGPVNSGVTIALSGGPTSKPNATTDSSGNYSFTGLTGGTYTLTPSLAGYTFNPSAPQVATSGSTTTQNFTETSTLTSFSISGTLTYGGAKTGRTFIRIFNSNCSQCNNAQAGTSLASAPSSTGTAYTVRGLQPGSYVVVAEVDTLNNGSPNASNPWGNSSTVTITSSNISGANVTLTDPTAPALVAPSGVQVAAGSTFALVQYDQHNSSALQDSNGREIATSYKVYYDTNSSFTHGTFSAFAAHGTHDNVFIVRNLTAGTYFFKVSALNANGEAASSTVSAVVGPGSGAFNISGKITFPGTATGPLYVGVFNGSAIIGTEILTPFTSPVSYTVTGVPAGNWQFFVIIDQNNNGLVEPSDISNVNNNQGGPPPLSVSGNITSNDITLTSAVSTIDVTTGHQKFNGGGNDTYSLNFNLNWGTKRPVIMTLLSGPNVPVPWDMSVDTNNGGGLGLPNSTVPLVGDTYQFQVTFSDGSTQTMPASVTVVLNSFAQSLAMQTTAPGSPTVPLLTWTAPASPPASYTYNVNLFNGNSTPQEFWSYYGNGTGNGIPSTQTSVLFDTDGSANPSSSLTVAGTYNWSVTVQDDTGNSAQFTTSYVVP